MKFHFAVILFSIACTQNALAQSISQLSAIVTTDSAEGWLPTVDQEQEVRKAAENYLRNKEQGRTRDAYEFLADAQKRSVSLSDFLNNVSSFNSKSGESLAHKVLQITWTKDPRGGPFPGVFAAVDIASKYAKIDRACGYLIMYQPPTGGPFLVLREEMNFLDNATAASIVKQHSQGEVDRIWKELSASCPNYLAEASP